MTERFFYEDAKPGADQDELVARCKAICSACRVEATCLDWAIDTNLRWGIAGGMTRRERQDELRRRRKEKQRAS